MEKEKFKQHFALATKYLISFTQEYCYNNFADSKKFIISPSSRAIDSHLSEKEIQHLKTINQFENELLTEGQVIDLLYQGNKVPLWINIEVYNSKPDLTVINLLCSRRFRDDSELNYRVDNYPPFHPLIPMPPDQLKIEVNGKFDVNWKKQLDDSKKKVDFFKKLGQIFRAN